MEGYESIFVTDPDLSQEVQADILDKIKKTVTQKGGEVHQYHLWGRRRLAYLINKKTHGDYHLMYLTGGNEMLKELVQQYRFTEEIMRFQTIKVADIQKESENFLELCKKESQTKTTPSTPVAAPPQTKATEPPQSEETPDEVQADNEASQALEPQDETQHPSEPQDETHNASEITSAENEEK